MSSTHLSRREVDELRPLIDRSISRFLGISEPSITSTALHCLEAGYDKRKTAAKLSALLDDKKAAKVAEKIFVVYDDVKASHKSKKRTHDERDKEKDKERERIREKERERERERDAKRPRTKENDSKKSSRSNHVSLTEEQKDKEKAKAFMENAQKAIKERQMAMGHKVPRQELEAIKPLLNESLLVNTVGSTYSHGLLTKPDAAKAQKLAALQAAIQNKLKAGILNLNANVDKPKPLILDESGRTVDHTGKEVHLTHVVPTLKANIRAKKREEFKAQMQESKVPEDFQETHFFDSRIGIKPAVRNKRALKFHEPGKFMQMAERIRMKAQLEKLQSEISQIARKTGISSATKLALIAPKTEALNEDVPNVDWWDSVILTKDCDLNSKDINSMIDFSTITNLVEHPAQMRPPTEPTKPICMPIFLTKKERKKLRRQNRREAWKEEQEKIRLGLEPPPEPKLRISNLMRVLGTEAVQDPTKIEAHVRQQMAKRLKAHEDANAARRLTADQRREKKARKLKEDTSLGVHVAVFRIRDLVNNASKKFKVETNAKQLYLTGCVMLYRDCNVVVVEGGLKQISKYKRLMLHRIKWEEDTTKDTEGKDVPNKCVLVWEGTSKHRHFGDIKFKVCPIEKQAREHFKKHQVEHYWDLAYSGAVLDNTDDTAV
ncbi:U4/U6 small nuclear ribonucleoprotein Prp3 [Phymastichus coffea]|uniref:U4/U6 small nuclear ribonucleoprotein Prp3 n=1 Tax=Phymastichus coffea TaxID=108790 RepID=UPI00273CB10D|nr:U4/U6 small nuclear ribonucleoprotein Prp3 [Phymastichus coffea]XP_058801100.1 U4/U6 small nuclear ribonucleoprotein Prp3 [Phymastichus coffea]